MTQKIYLTGVEEKPGKSFVSLGLLSILQSHYESFTVHKLFHETDEENQLQLIEAITQQKITPISSVSNAMKQIEQAPQEFISNCLEQIDDNATINYFEGTNFESNNESFEYQFNLHIAQNLNCKIIIVVCAKERTPHQTINIIQNAIQTAAKFHAKIHGIIVNRVPLMEENKMLNSLKDKFTELNYLSVIPEFEAISQPSVAEIANSLKAEILYGHEQLHRPVRQFTVAAKTLENFLSTRIDKHGMLIITPDDRVDILLGSLLADQSASYPKIAGIVLTGGNSPKGTLATILEGLNSPFPVLLSNDKTYETATKLYTSRFHIAAQDKKKLNKATTNMRNFLDESNFLRLLEAKSVEKITPSLFIYQLIKKAKKDKKHIVLPEGEDLRVLKAASQLLQREIVDITLLGNIDKIKSLAKTHRLKLPKVKLIDPSHNSSRKNSYATSYYELRKHKNIILPIAQERLSDPNYYGVMMVYHGDADGMVSGAMHTTADTVRPALEVIKTKPNTSLVSSIFIMCLPTKVMIYGDCAINLNPNSKNLAEIAYQAANITQQLNITPKVAMLSYSSGTSGKGESVEKVAKASKILSKTYPDLMIEGPIQYDAAVDLSVAKKKLPNSKVAGNANVLIFPDLNTGNNTYKAVQRESGALAIGPILLGLNKPVNDLSRGCLIDDIINTVLITAIQAQEP